MSKPAQVTIFEEWILLLNTGAAMVSNRWMSSMTPAVGRITRWGWQRKAPFIGWAVLYTTLSFCMCCW